MSKLSTQQFKKCGDQILEASQVLQRLSSFWLHRGIAAQEKSELLFLKYEKPEEYKKLFIANL